jgi:hypothetical protein
MNPQHERLLSYFEFDHLPQRLAEVSKLFYGPAHALVQLNGDPAETSAGLRKLLEAKDCAVRAVL